LNFREESEVYGAPLAIMGEVMTGMDRMQQARRCIGKVPCWVVSRSCRVEVTVSILY
jgi:hypothetical protein